MTYPYRWHTISIDFVGPLPESNDYNMIMVVVDSATKRTRIMPCHQNSTAKNIAAIFEAKIWKHHGIPKNIISDCDSKFMSEFWQAMCKSLKIKQTVSTSYHPQTDGQTEQKNGWIMTALRNLVNYYQDDWNEQTTYCGTWYKRYNKLNTGYTPFYLDTGRHPTSILDISLSSWDSRLTATSAPHTKLLKDNICNAQDKQIYNANKKRLASPFKVDDLVMLSLKNF